MGALVLHVQGVLGDSFYNLGWHGSFVGRKWKKSLESNAFMPFLDNMEREK